MDDEPISDLAKRPSGKTEKSEDKSHPEDPELGRWFWFTEDGKANPPKRYLVCITHMGSNYVEATYIGGSTTRIHLNDFYKVCEREEAADAFIASTIIDHQIDVKRLMGEVQQVTNRLAMGTMSRITEGDTTSSALARLNGSEVKPEQYKEALILAKKETLPDLFKKIEKANEQMALWMKAPMIPLQAEMGIYKHVTKLIDGRIFNVELYAGLKEQVVEVKGGKPADTTEKLNVYQRVLFMDEECLANYSAGGMDFKDLPAFDRWLASTDPVTKDASGRTRFERFFPFPRTTVAFRVRRHQKKRHHNNLRDHISFNMSGFEETDSWTFLYIRNGEQLWRLATQIAFGRSRKDTQDRNDDDDENELEVSKLYPDRDHPLAGGGSKKPTIMYAKDYGEWDRAKGRMKLITEQEYKARKAQYREDNKAHDVYLAQRKSHDKLRDPFLKARNDIVNKLNKGASRFTMNGLESVNGDGGAKRDATRDKLFGALAAADAALETWDKANPGPEYVSSPHDQTADFEKFSPDSVYYDDIQSGVHDIIEAHNRLVLVLQGLLDRSPILHPHPPWQLWTAEGFMTGLNLVYDAEMALVPTEKPPDFEAYRKAANAASKVGDVFFGQQDYFEFIEAAKYNEREAARAHRYKSDHYEKVRFVPDNNKGPGVIAHAETITAKGVRFEWEKEAREKTGKYNRWVNKYTGRALYGGRLKPEWRDVKKVIAIKVPMDPNEETPSLFTGLLNVSRYKPGDFKQFYADPRTRANYIQWAAALLTAEDWHFRAKQQEEEEKTSDQRNNKGAESLG